MRAFTAAPLFDRQDIEQSIPARFESIAAQYPHHIAAQIQEETLTYGELNREANRIAHAILTQSDKEPIRAALLLDRNMRFFPAMLGILKSGKIWVPIDNSLSRDTITHILKDSQTSLIITDNNNHQPALDLSHDNGNRRILNIDRLDQQLSSENPDLNIPPDATAYIQYTSGSTGQSKGVIKSHQSRLYETIVYAAATGLEAGDRVTLLTTWNHAAATTAILRTFLTGTTLCVYNLKEEGLAGLADWLIANEITLYHSVPTVFRQFVATITPQHQFPKLRLLHLGGEALSVRDVALYKRHFPKHCVLMNHLTSAESGVCARFFIYHDTEINGNIVPVGYPPPGKEILLLDEPGQPVKNGEIGEIVVKSAYLPAGYWQRPDLTQSKFPPNTTDEDERICRTGDIGRILPDGCLLYLGRKDSQVKIYGQRVELTEIEMALLRHEAIKEAAVITQEDGEGNQYLVAYIAPTGQHLTPTIHELRRFLNKTLPDYMIPARLVPLDRLPQLPSGKTNRIALPQIDGQSLAPESADEFVPPQTPEEKTIAAIWTELLGFERIGIRDNFFELGGDSLKAMILALQIEKKIGKKIASTAIYQAPTIAQLARIVFQRHIPPAEFAALTPLRLEGANPPLFCVPGNFGNVFTDLRYLAKYLDTNQPFYGLQDSVDKPARIKDLAGNYMQEIRKAQPQGPYFLTGICSGSMIVFEISRLLKEQGQEVALLALVEPVAPTITDFGAYLRFTTKTLSRIVKHAGRYANKQQIGQPAAVQADYFRAKRKVIANSWALRRYKLRPQSGSMHLFLTTETLQSPEHSRLKWKELATGGVAIHEIPGTHNQITGTYTTVPEELMKALAEKLTDCIQAILSAPAQ